MIFHGLKDKSVILVLIFLIYSIPSFAFAETEKTVSEETKAANFNYRLGLTYGLLGKYQKAIDAYIQAIKIKPDHTEAHFGLANSYKKLGKYKEAADVQGQIFIYDKIVTMKDLTLQTTELVHIGNMTRLMLPQFNWRY